MLVSVFVQHFISVMILKKDEIEESKLFACLRVKLKIFLLF